MLAAVRSATLLGVEGRPVTVEVHVSTGLPGFQIVGLPDEACRESRDRVRAAVMSSGLPWPSCRMTVNLAPSNQRKGGSGLDLAIAIGLLAAHGEIPSESFAGMGFIGELGLDGSLRAVAGVAPMVGALAELVAVVPRPSFREAKAISPARVCVAENLREIVDALNGEAPWPAEPDDDFVDDEPACARPRRRTWPAAGSSSPRGRGCGRAPPVVGRATWRGQDDVGAAAHGFAATAQPGHVARGHDGALRRGRPFAGCRHDPSTAVPRPTSQQLDGVVGRRRHVESSPWGDQLGPCGCSVSRRVG